MMSTKRGLRILWIGCCISLAALSLGTPLFGQFLYVANNAGTFLGNVSGYAINASTGALTPMPGSPFAAGANPFSVAVDPTSKFVYVVNESDNNVSGYTINTSTGVLTPIPGSPFAAGYVPTSVAVDPTGKFAYVANVANANPPNNGNVLGYRVNATTGALTPIPGSPFAAGSFPYSLAVDPTGKSLMS